MRTNPRPEVTLEIVRQIAMGLDCIHQAGRIHRDVKLSNVMVDRQGCVKLLDLGLIRAVKPGDAEMTLGSTLDGSGSEAGPEAARGSLLELTRAGQVVGTLEYLAPEQWNPSQNVSPKSDIFAFGVTAYYLLTGRYARGDQKLPAASIRYSPTD